MDKLPERSRTDTLNIACVSARLTDAMLALVDLAIQDAGINSNISSNENNSQAESALKSM